MIVLHPIKRLDPKLFSVALILTPDMFLTRAVTGLAVICVRSFNHFDHMYK